MIEQTQLFIIIITKNVSLINRSLAKMFCTGRDVMREAQFPKHVGLCCLIDSKII